MPTRVRFWRDVNSNGHNAHAFLNEFEVPEGASKEEAVKAAKKKLCEYWHASSWERCAHGYDVLTLDTPSPEEATH